MGWAERTGDGWRGVYRDAAGRKVKGPTVMHKEAARAWANDAESKSRRGLDPAAARMPLSEWAARWWEARVVADTTAANDKARYDAIVAEWGDWPLEVITTLAVQGWVKRLSRGMAAGTVAKYHRLLATMLTAAVRERVLADNPARWVTLPTPSKGHEVYLTREEVDKLVDKLPAPYDVAAYALAYTGLRWGELAGLRVGLRVPRLDLMRGRVDVRETLVEINGHRSLKAYPKTSASHRTVPLPEHLVTTLAEHLREHPARPGGFVFVNAEGNPLSRHRMRLVVHKAADEAGVTDLRPHDLRHTYASWLVQAGVPLYDVQRLLGHSSITVTQRYAHLAPDSYDRPLAALARPSALGAILGAERPSSTVT